MKMRTVHVTLRVEVPEWASHVAVDADGKLSALHTHRNGAEHGIGYDDETCSWFGAMQASCRVENPRGMCFEVR